MFDLRPQRHGVVWHGGACWCLSSFSGLTGLHCNRNNLTRSKQTSGGDAYHYSTSFSFRAKKTWFTFKEDVRWYVRVAYSNAHRGLFEGQVTTPSTDLPKIVIGGLLAESKKTRTNEEQNQERERESNAWVLCARLRSQSNVLEQGWR